MKYFILLFLISSHAFASDNLTTKSWPKEQPCAHCVNIQVYGLSMALIRPVKNIVMLPTLGLNIELENSNFFFSIPPESTLKFIQDKLNIKGWNKYYELIAVKSSDSKIEGLRSALEITTAEGFYRYKNKKYTAFFINRLNAPLGTPSEIMIIPNDKTQAVVKIGGKFTLKDTELILSHLTESHP